VSADENLGQGGERKGEMEELLESLSNRHFLCTAEAKWVILI